MSYLVAHIDQNDKSTILAYNETTGVVEAVRCDPVTGALYVYGVQPDANTPAAYTRAAIDANDRDTATAYNETTGTVEALRCSVNNELLVKMVS